MPDQETDKRRSNWLLRVLVPFLGSDLIEVLPALWRLGRQVIRAQSHEGMYEVLDYQAQLVLKDAKGKKAVFEKRQKVRFLQDNIIAYHDQAWGDGDIFVDYKCSPGEAVDRYREGHRWRILISLRETKKRGDVEDFRIRREIGNGFRKSTEFFQTEIDHRTRSLTVSVVFPRGRHPKRVALLEQNRNRTTPLGPSHLKRLPDGCLEAAWHTNRPRLFEAYVINWEW